MHNSSSGEEQKKSRVPVYLSISIVAALLLAYFLIPSVQEFFAEAWNVLTSNDEQRVKAWVSNFGVFGPIILIVAMIVQMFLLVIPTIMLMVVSILAYGPVWGSMIIFAAVFSSSSVGYLIGSQLGQERVEKIIGQKTERKVGRFIDDYGFWAVIVTRLNPFLSNDAISFVGGILRMGYWKFMGATLLGIAPLTIFLAIMGRSTDSLKMGLLWCSLISLAGFVLYVWWDRKKRKKQKNGSKS